MKKVSAIVLLVAIFCTILTGCGVSTQNKTSSPGMVVTTDEEAIRQVVIAYYQSGFDWDFETMKACVASEFPVYDPYETAKNTYLQGVDKGFMVEADVDQFIELERQFSQKLGQSIQFNDWEFHIAGDAATATITATSSGVDLEKVQEQSGDVEYRDKLFLDICQMDEITAKTTLSPEEFSTVHLQVQELEYELWLQNLSSSEQRVTVHLKKTGNCWYISRIALAQ